MQRFRVWLLEEESRADNWSFTGQPHYSRIQHRPRKWLDLPRQESLSDDEVQALFDRWNEHGDKDSLRRLEKFLRTKWTRLLYGKYANTTLEDVEDAFQTAFDMALQRHDPKLGPFERFFFVVMKKRLMKARTSNWLRGRHETAASRPEGDMTGEPTRVAGSREFMSRLRDILARKLQQANPKYVLAFCMSLGLDCGRPGAITIPDAIKAGGVHKFAQGQYSHKVDPEVISKRLKDEHGIESSSFQVTQYLSYVRKMIRDEIEALREKALPEWSANRLIELEVLF